ncbi:MAG TPA: YdaS family helix-turn-helix protein [Methylibium sp.]|nr:YdaS family helix-turn-helix protein [Methylibium sp.]
MKLTDYFKASQTTQDDFAKRLGVTQGMVGFWVRGKPPTPARAVQIERATQGAVTRQDLRPDDWREIWPELSEQPGQGTSQVAQEAS